MQKVLLIDNDEMSLMAVEQALENQGYRVLSTADGPAGVALYREQHPDLVLLDIGLPSMSGTDVLREIRTYDPKARIIVVTAYSSLENRLLALRYGACDFMEKPVTTEELLRRILTTLQTVRVR